MGVSAIPPDGRGAVVRTRRIGLSFAGLCYAEFAAMIPIAGSAYTYAYATLGESSRGSSDGDLVLEYMFGASTVAVGWSGHSFVNFLQAYMRVSRAWTQADRRPLGARPRAVFRACAGRRHQPACPPARAALTILLIMVGMKESANFNNIVVFHQRRMRGGGAGDVLRIAFVDAANWHPFIPANTGEFGHFGWSGIARARPGLLRVHRV